jgi:hypothetical protein
MTLVKAVAGLISMSENNPELSVEHSIETLESSAFSAAAVVAGSATPPLGSDPLRLTAVKLQPCVYVQFAHT